MTKHKIVIEKQGGESTSALMRRFTKTIQQAGIVKKAKSRKHYERPLSETLKKHRALRRIERRKEKRRLWKLGKI